MNVNGKEIEMDIDTGSSVTVFNDTTHKIIKQEAELTPVKGQLRTYLGPKPGLSTDSIR